MESDPLAPRPAGPSLPRRPLGFRAFLGLALAALSLGGCTVPTKADVNTACENTRQCAFGLECRQKTCQYIAFSDCDPEALSQGRQPCLNGEKCRDGKCTVFCTSNQECEKGLCKVGVCVVNKGDLRQCYDNRDCIWPESCFHGQCVTKTDAFRCASDLDCGVGFRCVNQRCQ